MRSAIRGRTLTQGLLFAACIAALATPASAQSTVFRTRRSASSSWNPILPLTFGVGLDFEKGDEQKELAVPWLLEYNFTEHVRVTVESGIKFLDSMDPEIGKTEGLDDTETGVDYEFLRERRYTPSLTLVGLVRWPTATDGDLGDPGTDVSAGLTAAKDLVHFDLESNLLFTYTTDGDSSNLIEFAVAATFPLRYNWELQLGGHKDLGRLGPEQLRRG
jgi:hypothetical protein